MPDVRVGSATIYTPRHEDHNQLRSLCQKPEPLPRKGARVARRDHRETVEHQAAETESS